MTRRISSFLPALLRYHVLRGVGRLRFVWGFVYELIRFLVFSMRHKLSRPETIRSILVIRFSGLGDVVRTSPVVRKLKASYPQATLHYFTSQAARPLLENNPYVDALYTEEALDELAQRGYDLVVNLQFFDTEPIVRELMGRIRYRRVSGPRVTRWGSYRGCGHTYYFRSGMEKLCRTAFLSYDQGDEESVEIVLSPNQLQRAQALYEHLGLVDGQPYVGLHLGSDEACTSWCWKKNVPVSYLRQLADRFTAKCSCILTGQRADRTEAEQASLTALENEIPGLISLVDRLTLEELIFILKRVSVLVTTDSGPLHMALGVGTPVVALFGPYSRSVLSLQRRGRRYTVLNSPTSCPPCAENCDTRRRMECLERIPVDAVVEAATGFLSRRKITNPS